MPLVFAVDPFENLGARSNIALQKMFCSVVGTPGPPNLAGIYYPGTTGRFKWFPVEWGSYPSGGIRFSPGIGKGD
jgi:hypothetical protein